jgi:hypothetical protein
MDAPKIDHAPGDIEKDVTVDDKRVEDVAEEPSRSSDGELEANDVEIPETEAKRILAKVDYRLVPTLALLYLVAFIDRSNSGFPHLSAQYNIS